MANIGCLREIRMLLQFTGIITALITVVVLLFAWITSDPPGTVTDPGWVARLLWVIVGLFAVVVWMALQMRRLSRRLAQLERERRSERDRSDE